jgi:hypothetical protein
MKPRFLLTVFILPLLLTLSCGRSASQPSAEVTSLGKIEITAKVAQIIGDFPVNDLYNYTYIMKYHVLKTHRGKLEGEDVYIGHYNPLKPRAGAADKFSGKVGGNATRFQVGHVHRMALDFPLEDCYMGAIIDKHFKEPGTRYWALWTDKAAE